MRMQFVQQERPPANLIQITHKLNKTLLLEGGRLIVGRVMK